VSGNRDFIINIIYGRGMCFVNSSVCRNLEGWFIHRRTCSVFCISLVYKCGMHSCTYYGIYQTCGLMTVKLNPYENIWLNNYVNNFPNMCNEPTIIIVKLYSLCVQSVHLLGPYISTWNSFVRRSKTPVRHFQWCHQFIYDALRLIGDYM
jgi:hypothetical protein